MFKPALALIALAVLAVASISCGSDEPTGPRWRVVLEPAATLTVEDVEGVFDDVIEVAERRIKAFGGQVNSSSVVDRRIELQVSGLLQEDVERALVPTGLLQFCEPVMDVDGNVAIARSGTVNYEAGSCEPERNEAGEIVLADGAIEFVPWARQGMPAAASNPRDSDIVWQPATGLIDGEEIVLDSTYLLPNTSVIITGTVIQQPTLFFEFEGDGVSALEQVTERLSERNYPIAMFLDGEPLLDTNGLMIAPQVIAELTFGQGTISGFSEEKANDLSMLLNSGAFPIPLRIIEISEMVD